MIGDSDKGEKQIIFYENKTMVKAIIAGVAGMVGGSVLTGIIVSAKKNAETKKMAEEMEKAHSEDLEKILKTVDAKQAEFTDLLKEVQDKLHQASQNYEQLQEKYDALEKDYKAYQELKDSDLISPEQEEQKVLHLGDGITVVAKEPEAVTMLSEEEKDLDFDDAKIAGKNSAIPAKKNKRNKKH